MLNVTLKPFSSLDDILDEVTYYETQKNNEMNFSEITLEENLTNMSTGKLIKFLKKSFPSQQKPSDIENNIKAIRSLKKILFYMQ